MLRRFVPLLVVSCGGISTGVDASTADASTSDATDVFDASQSEAAPTCARVDAGNCTTGATIISCDPDGGVGTICLGDHGHDCGYGDAGCIDECKDGEYAAWCGSMVQSSSRPSSTCRDLGGLPNGSDLFCCPCN